MAIIAFSQHENGEDCCGSDSMFLCDGRWSVSTCIDRAKEYYSKLINKPYGFKIYVGTVLHHRPISELIKL